MTEKYQPHLHDNALLTLTVTNSASTAKAVKASASPRCWPAQAWPRGARSSG